MHLEAKTLNELVSSLLEVEAELGQLITKQLIIEMEPHSMDAVLDLEDEFIKIQDKRDAILYFMEHHN